MGEYVIVLAVVAGAAAYLIRRMYAARKGKAGCGCGCNCESGNKKICAGVRE